MCIRDSCYTIPADYDVTLHHDICIEDACGNKTYYNDIDILWNYLEAVSYTHLMKAATALRWMTASLASVCRAFPIRCSASISAMPFCRQSRCLSLIHI